MNTAWKLFPVALVLAFSATSLTADSSAPSDSPPPPQTPATQPSAPMLSQRQQRQATNKVPKAAKGLEGQLKSASAEQQQAAIDALNAMAANQPVKLAQELPRLIKPLLDLQKFSELERYTRVAILALPEETINVSDNQSALVQALIGQEKYEEALPEARRLYNVATQKTCDRAIGLLSICLRHTRGIHDPDVVARFQEQQRVGATVRSAADLPTDNPNLTPNIVLSIPIDATPYEAAINASSNSGGVDHFIAKGNLLLLAGRPAEASQAFLTVCDSSLFPGKEILRPLEGIIRSQRANAGIVGPANATVLACKLANRTDKALASFPQALSMASISFAGQRLTLPTGVITNPSESLADSRGVTFTARGQGATQPLRAAGNPDPVLIVRMAPKPSKDLLNWLLQWQRNSAQGIASSGEDREQLTGILGNADIQAVALFQLASAFFERSHDELTTAYFYRAAGKAAEMELQKSHDDPRSYHAITVLHALNDAMTDYKHVLWPLIKAEKRSIFAAQTLYQLYSTLVRFYIPSDEQLESTITHARIGRAECMVALGNEAGALTAIEQIDLKSLTRSEAADYQRTKGLIFFNRRDYERCVECLSTTLKQTQDADFDRTGWAMLAVSLSHVGQAAAADNAFDEWLSRFHPPASDAALILTEIEGRH